MATNIELTDDQIVLALIAAYKSRGTDMSAMLDDPLFDKLPAATKIKAIQNHAGTIGEGIKPGYGKVDYTRIGANAILSIPRGALTGASIGAALAARSGNLGVGALHGALVGGTLTGVGGAITGAFSSLDETSRRKALKAVMETAGANGSTQNAVKALTTAHAGMRSNTLRKNILDRISELISEHSHGVVAPVLHAQDTRLQEMNTNINQFTQ